MSQYSERRMHVELRRRLIPPYERYTQLSVPAHTVYYVYCDGLVVKPYYVIMSCIYDPHEQAFNQSSGNAEKYYVII